MKAWLPWKSRSVCLPAANKNTLEMVQYGVEGSSTFLECQARSPHALIKWHLQRDNSDRRKEVSCPVACLIQHPASRTHPDQKARTFPWLLYSYDDDLSFSPSVWAGSLAGTTSLCHYFPMCSSQLRNFDWMLLDFPHRPPAVPRPRGRAHKEGLWKSTAQWYLTLRHYLKVLLQGYVERLPRSPQAELPLIIINI